MKYYAVAKGRKTGIFTSWPDAEKQVKGFKKFLCEGFKTLSEAEEFIANPVYKPKVKASKTSIEIPEGAIVVYTDGSALGNPGPGGYGVVIKDQKELSGGYNLTTNNRMEIKAVIVALEELQGKKHTIILHSDSQYVINSINKGWAKGWKKRGWKKSDGNPAKNADMWAVLLELLDTIPNITFVWVKGHAGNPLNEKCDQLANSFAQQKNLPNDRGYLLKLHNDNGV